MNLVSVPLGLERVHIRVHLLNAHPTVVELRARQRTFDGAYGRSALGNLGYALTVLRLFDERFHRSKLPSPLLPSSPSLSYQLIHPFQSAYSTPS